MESSNASFFPSFLTALSTTIEHNTDCNIRIERNPIGIGKLQTGEREAMPIPGGQDAHMERSRIWSLQAWRHSVKAVASRRSPPQIPQLTRGATTEPRTSDSSAPVLPRPPSRAAASRGGWSECGMVALLAVLGRGPSVDGTEACRAPCSMADGSWGDSGGARGRWDCLQPSDLKTRRTAGFGYCTAIGHGPKKWLFSTADANEKSSRLRLHLLLLRRAPR